MKIITRYILRHFFPIFGLALSAIVGLYLIIDFFEKVDNLLEKNVPAFDILSYFFLKLPFVISQGIPMASLLGSLVALGILKRNRELIALETAGIKATSYVTPILLTAMALSVVHFLTDETLARIWNQKAQQIWQRQVLNQQASLSWGHENVWYRGRNAIYQIHLYNKEEQTLEKVSLFFLNTQFKLAERLDAKRVRWKDDRWIAEDGLILRFSGPNVEQEWFAQRELNLSETPQDFSRLETIPAELNWLDLYSYSRKIRSEGYNAKPYEVELHMRLAMPLTTLIVALLGVTIALSQGLHGGIAVGVGIALIVASLYFMVLHLGSALAMAGILPPFIGVWLGDVIFATLAGYLWMVRVQ
jgi:lipopolysaccharide export system permease protein